MGNMDQMHVLVVDDDQDIIDAMTDVLRQEGYRVSAAHDGAEALSMLRANAHPRVILLDWMMPGMDGATFAEEKRRDPALAAIPVVLLTADARASTKAADAGIGAFLRKPVTLDDLLSMLERYR